MSNNYYGRIIIQIQLIPLFFSISPHFTIEYSLSGQCGWCNLNSMFDLVYIIEKKTF